jgi:Putative metallopeptidase
MRRTGKDTNSRASTTATRSTFERNLVSVPEHAWGIGIALALQAVVMSAPTPTVAQPASYQPRKIEARINAASAALAGDPKFKNLSPKHRQDLAEFVSGNILFVICHEIAHAAMTQLGLPVLGRAEDAADSFATLRMIKIGSEFSSRVLAEAARGWFLAARRDQKSGEPVVYYDEHGLDQQRAYQIVCLMVGSDKDKYKDLARETRLPPERQESCARDYGDASYSWGLLLQSHLRAPDQPRTPIEVAYGESKGKFEHAAAAARSVQLLEAVAENLSDTFAWPDRFTLEMQSCGGPNAQWVPATHTLTVCYELAEDFAELYRAYGVAPVDSGKRKSK